MAGVVERRLAAGFHQTFTAPVPITHPPPHRAQRPGVRPPSGALAVRHTLTGNGGLGWDGRPFPRSLGQGAGERGKRSKGRMARANYHPYSPTLLRSSAAKFLLSKHPAHLLPPPAPPPPSPLLPLRHMRVPRPARFRLHLRKPRARRGIGDADKMLAGRALNLPPRELEFAFQRLITVRAVKFKFVGVHSLHSQHAQFWFEKYIPD